MRPTDFGSETDGASAAEFALVLPVLLLFIFGLVEFGMLMFSVSQLHWAVEGAARCGSVKVDCKTNSSGTFTTNTLLMTNYARDTYRGMAPVTFQSDTNGACAKSGATNTGRKVSANATFTMNLGVYYKSIPLTADACFP